MDERIAMFQGTVRDNLTLWDELISGTLAPSSAFGIASQLQLLKLVQALREILADIDSELDALSQRGAQPH